MADDEISNKSYRYNKIISYISDELHSSKKEQKIQYNIEFDLYNRCCRCNCDMQ